MPKITGELCAACLLWISYLRYLKVTLVRRATISASVVASKLKARILWRGPMWSCSELNVLALWSSLLGVRLFSSFFFFFLSNSIEGHMFIFSIFFFYTLACFRIRFCKCRLLQVLVFSVRTVNKCDVALHKYEPSTGQSQETKQYQPSWGTWPSKSAVHLCNLTSTRSAENSICALLRHYICSFCVPLKRNLKAAGLSYSIPKLGQRPQGQGLSCNRGAGTNSSAITVPVWSCRLGIGSAFTRSVCFSVPASPVSDVF